MNCYYSSNFQTIPLIVQTPHLFPGTIIAECQKLNNRLITVLYIEEDAGFTYLILLTNNSLITLEGCGLQVCVCDKSLVDFRMTTECAACFDAIVFT